MLLEKALSLAENALLAQTPHDSSAAFFESMQSLGASYIQTRAYRRPFPTLTSATHWEAGGFILRNAPRQWKDSAAFNYVCFEFNPLLNAIREGHTRYRFSDFAPRDRAENMKYWDALAEANVHDALCATSYASRRRIASLHLGFHERSFTANEALCIHLAGLMLTERILELETPDNSDDVQLTPRERDCLSFVAEGKSDWEISAILGISQSTAKFHVDNARKKLGAVNRTHAIARFVASGLFTGGPVKPHN
jgi:LuxR family transcriptional regulator, quorum-sensing system regulator BjaR1